MTEGTAGDGLDGCRPIEGGHTIGSRDKTTRWRPVTALLLTVQLAGCYSWRAESVSPARLTAAEHPAIIRVTRPDGSQLLLRQPAARSDSLFGVTAEGVEIGLPLPQVSKVEVRRFSTGKTGGLVLGVAGCAIALVGLAYFIALSSCEEPCFGT